MKKIRLATIDIGTNTLLMLITDVFEDGSYKVLRDEHAIARLGEGVDKSNTISEDAIGRAGSILERYKIYSEELNVDIIIASGTSVLRDASNSVKVCGILSGIIGSEIKVISGLEEARYSYLGTVEADEQAIVVDIGGGSTEIIAQHPPGKFERASFDIGSVRLTERFLKMHPPDEFSIKKAVEFINNELIIPKGIASDQKVYAVAGTPTTIAAVALGLKDFERDRIQGYNLSENELDRVLQLFLGSSIDAIVDEYGVHPKRADVITAGTIILTCLLKKINAKSCIISTRGLRYGLMVDFINNYFK